MARNLKQHILQTASELFYRQGIKATGVDAIVKAAGTTKMSLYKYFPSKQDLGCWRICAKIGKQCWNASLTVSTVSKNTLHSEAKITGCIRYFRGIN